MNLDDETKQIIDAVPKSKRSDYVRQAIRTNERVKANTKMEPYKVKIKV